MNEDKYYLKPVGKPYKVEKYTYEYDEYKDSMSGTKSYWVNIIFEDDEFSYLDFGDKGRKRFDDNLRPKELDLLNKIQEEIENIKSRREKEKRDILKVTLKPTQEQIEVVNGMIGDSETSKDCQEVFKSTFATVIEFILKDIHLDKIPFEPLKVPSIKISIP